MRLWISQILSQLTVNVMNFLLLILLFNETGSAIAVALLWVAYALPAILVGPIAATYVDMSDRRKTLLYTNLIQALIIAGYAYVQSLSIFLLYGVVIIYSFFNQFYVPAEFATLPSLVKRKQYSFANGLFFLTQQSSVVLGFSLAGILNSKLGFENTMYLCSVFVFIAFLSVTGLPKTVLNKKIPKNFDDAFFAFFKEISLGYRFLKSKPSIYIPFILMLCLQITTAVVVVSAPIVALHIFKINLDLVGVFVAAPVGVGAVCASIIVPKLLKVKLRKITLIKYGLVFLSFSMLYLSLVAGRLNIMLRMSTGLFALMGVGIAFISIYIPLQTQLQEVTPVGMRGRVFGNFWFMVTIATVFPVILSGTIAELLGIRVLLSIIACVSIAGIYVINTYGYQFLEKNGMGKKASG